VSEGAHRPGWKTSEFWVTIATTAWTLFGGVLPPVAQAVIGAVVPAAYTLSRALAKRPHPAPSSPASASITVGNP
jgi:hypothetical protein